MERLRWYLSSDKNYLITGFTRNPAFRCRHRSRFFGLQCWRAWTYDGWCGLHNSTCWHHTMTQNRCTQERGR